MSANKPVIPTLAEIRDRMLADVAYYLPGSNARPFKSVLTVLVTVFAGAVWSVYGFADWMLKQLNPLTANETWLAIWGAKLGVPRKPAVKAVGSVLFKGSGVISAGTLLQAPDQRRYITTNSGAIGDAIRVEAVIAGYVGNIPTLSTLSLVNPIAGVALEVVANPIVGGLDQETLAAWAARIDERLAQMQTIGDADDHVRWAKQAHTAILDAWVASNTPLLGQVTIYCLLAADSDPALVLPDAQKLLNRLKNVGGQIVLTIPETLPITVRMAGVEDTALQERITQDIRQLVLSKRTKKAWLYPEEIERIVSSHTEAEFVLLEPIRKVVASESQIMSLAEVLYE